MNHFGWKDVNGWEGYYLVSTTGLVWSNFSKRFLTLRADKGGYMTVHLRGPADKHVKVHRLVAMAFIPNPQKKKFVNHLDGDKSNNMLSNLQWCTQSENEKHAHKIGLKNHKGHRNPPSKLSEDQVLKIISLYENSDLYQHQIADMFGVTQTTISSILAKKSWAYLHD